MARFEIEQREIELESSFTPRLWPLLHNVPVLYEALLRELQDVGLSSMDLRPEVGNGAVGSASVGFWLFGGKTNVRIGLDNVRVQSALLVSDVVSSIDRVMAAMRQSSPELQFRTHSASYACHGRIEGTKATDFMRQFVPAVPAIEGFGGNIGAGAAFYFAEAPPVISSVYTLDISRMLQDGLFVRVFIVLEGGIGGGAEIHAAVEERVRAALVSVGLEIE